MKVGQNVEVTIAKNKMTIVVDLSKDYGESASGKTIKIASSGGNKPFDGPGGEVYLGLNVYKYPDEDEKPKKSKKKSRKDADEEEEEEE